MISIVSTPICKDPNRLFDIKSRNRRCGNSPFLYPISVKEQDILSIVLIKLDAI